MAFTIDEKNKVLNNACYILTGENLKWMLAFMNSSPIIWYSEITNMNKTGVGDAQVGAQNIILFPIPQPNDRKAEMENIVKELLKDNTNKELLQCLSVLVYEIYGIDEREIAYLENLNL